VIVLLKTIAIFAMTALIAYTAVHDGIMGNGIRDSIRIVRSLRVMMFVQNLFVQLLVICTALMLNQLPVLNWAWWSIIDGGESVGGTNFAFAWISMPIIAPIMFILLAVAMPKLAQLEEELFRQGTKGIKSAIKRSIAFGLIHCLMGVSIATGLALSIAGMWFTYQYFRGGVRLSTAYHTAWNLFILATLAALLLM
jgi:hypothetical protein